jgi:DNA-binding GntR family transcriptional regulator
VWNSLARQLAVVWGLGQTSTGLGDAVREHAELLGALEAADLKAATLLLTAHINWHQAFDFEAALEQRRQRAG